MNILARAYTQQITISERRKKMEFVSAAKMNKILKLFGSVSTLMVVDSE